MHGPQVWERGGQNMVWEVVNFACEGVIVHIRRNLSIWVTGHSCRAGCGAVMLSVALRGDMPVALRSAGLQ